LSQTLTHIPDHGGAAVLVLSIEAQREALHRALERCAQKPKAKRIHALRVAARRLQSALGLASALGVEPKSRLRRRLAKLLPWLSPVRDAHVARHALETQAPDAAGVATLTKLLHARERRLARKVRRRLSTFDLARFERELSSMEGELVALSTERAEPSLTATLRRELSRQHLKVERCRQRVNARRPKSLHRLRLSLKRYRYALDALAGVLPGEARELSQRIAELQDQLGSAHDAHWLAEHARQRAKARPKLRGLAQSLEQASEAAQAAGAQAVANTTLEWPLMDESLTPKSLR
jgi:CHAD domain-containing protein